MKILKAIISFFAMLYGGMQGGQGKQAGKAPRRFGVPGIALLTGWSFGWRWKYLVFLAYVPLLSLGYGVDSSLGAILGHNEVLIRVCYGFLISLPIYAFTLKRGVFASIALIIAYSIHAGSVGYVSWFGDLLVEDMIRFSTLGIIILFNILFKEE